MKYISGAIELCLILIAIAGLVVLFWGDPDIADALRVKTLDWAAITTTGEDSK
jgi:hypothetical protein